MRQDETAMAAALRRAGFNVGSRLGAVVLEVWRDENGDRARFAKALWARLHADTELQMAAMQMFADVAEMELQGSPEAGYATFSEKAKPLVPASGDAADEMPDGGYSVSAKMAEHEFPPTRQQNGGEAGFPAYSGTGLAASSRPSPTSRGAGANARVPQGHRSGSPAREQSEAAKRAAKAVARVEAQTVLDRFRITERNGAMTPIGDVSVDRLDSLIYYTGRRRWVADREHTLLCLVKEDVSKFPQVPEGKLLREIFDEKAIQSKIDLAARMIKPIEDRQEAVNA